MSPRVAVVDYGVGNLRSVERALESAGARCRVSADAVTIAAADGVVLPGVGAFGAALDALEGRGLRQCVVDAADSGRPLLGVCLGHQLLFEWSEESGGRAGLGLLRGRVRRLAATRGKVPHIGWNTLSVLRPCSLLAGLESGVHAYFVHAYAAEDVAPEEVVATTDHGGPLIAVCARGSVVGTQFHPEKSGADGLRLYANFVGLCAAGVTA